MSRVAYKVPSEEREGGREGRGEVSAGDRPGLEAEER